MGPGMVGFFSRMMSEKRVPEQAYRSCLGVLRLEQKYGLAELEAAAIRANSMKAATSSSISSILAVGSERAFEVNHHPVSAPAPEA